MDARRASARGIHVGEYGVRVMQPRREYNKEREREIYADEPQRGLAMRLSMPLA